MHLRLSYNEDWVEQNLPTPFHVQWTTQSNVNKLAIADCLLAFLVQTFGKDGIHLRMNVRNIHSFRCHPNFQSAGVVFDWMRIQFTDMLCPCCLATVVVSDDNTYSLVVQACVKKTGIKSMPLTEWK